ncbi:MAG TPA: oligosaccharide flippase family protein [Ktedonobacteraceae bacterium]|jgi:O-antigen/teichoic acid export membrane protein|nr:oligosaccharide flippase family protein [Ktedonobacteraceae bacterium]
MVIPLHKPHSEGGKKTGPVAPTLQLSEVQHVEQEKYGDEIDLLPTAVMAAVNCEQLPTMLLPGVSIDQLETRKGIQAVRSLVPRSPTFIDPFGISEQPTWILPVLPGSTRPEKGASAEPQRYVSILRHLVKSSGLYALSSLASPLLSLLMTPLLTRYLSYSAYGALVIVNTFIALMIGVTQLGLGDAFFRSYVYNHETPRERKEVLSTLILLLLGITVLVALGMIGVSPWLAAVLLGDASFGDAMRFVALIMLLQNLSIPGLVWLRAENHPLLYTNLSLANLLLNAGFTVLLVLFLHMGMMGALLASACGYAFMVCCTLPVILVRAGLVFRMSIARELLAFGAPHVINLLSGWVLQLIDRYLLGRLGSLSEVGSYAVAYSLGGVLSAVVITPFSMVWWVTIYSIAKKAQAKAIFTRIFRWFSLLLLFVAYGLSLAGRVLLDLVYPPAYHVAGPVIPVIALSILFSGVYVILPIGVALQGKTWITSLSITAAAIINVALNLALIPSFGSMGAAFATLVAYIALAIIAYFVNQKLYPVPFELGLFGLALFLGLVLYIGSDALLQGAALLPGICLHASALLLYGGCLLLIVVFSGRKKSLH